jgi:hypothetical protein
MIFDKTDLRENMAKSHLRRSRSLGTLSTHEEYPVDGRPHTQALSTSGNAQRSDNVGISVAEMPARGRYVLFYPEGCWKID